MKKVLSIPVILFAIASIFVLSSCDRERFRGGWETSTDDSFAQSIFDDVTKVLDEEAQSQNDLNDFVARPAEDDDLTRNGCAIVNLELTDGGFPATLTIDFGEGCTSLRDGRTRSGKVVSVFTGRYREEGTVITTTLHDYMVNGFAAEGSKQITNMGRNSSDNLSYEIVVSDAQIATPNNETHKWSSTRIREWVEGEATTYASNGLEGILDDVYLITGTGEGVSRKGIAYTAQTVEPIRVELDCKWIVSGVFEISPEGFEARTVDYGSGACDSEVTVMVGDFTTTINLP